MNILVIDIATRIGHAQYIDGDINSGTKSFAGLPGQPIGALFEKWTIWLVAQLDDNRMDLIGYELVNFPINSRAYEMIYHGMVGIMLAEAYKRGIETRGWTVIKVKQAATDSAKATKRGMIAAARAQWPNQNIVDDNQADALWVLYLAMGAMKIPQKKHYSELF